jgi:hypothetical protein
MRWDLFWKVYNGVLLLNMWKNLGGGCWEGVLVPFWWNMSGFWGVLGLLEAINWSIFHQMGWGLNSRDGTCVRKGVVVYIDIFLPKTMVSCHSTLTNYDIHTYSFTPLLSYMDIKASIRIEFWPNEVGLV